MATITVYTFEDEDGGEDTYTTTNLQEAKDRAARYKLAVIANDYEWSDSELVVDYRNKAQEEDDYEEEYRTSEET